MLLPDGGPYLDTSVKWDIGFWITHKISLHENRKHFQRGAIIIREGLCIDEKINVECQEATRWDNQQKPSGYLTGCTLIISIMRKTSKLSKSGAKILQIRYQHETDY